jgi:hypothetical protein
VSEDHSKTVNQTSLSVGLGAGALCRLSKKAQELLFDVTSGALEKAVL